MTVTTVESETERAIVPLCPRLCLQRGTKRAIVHAMRSGAESPRWLLPAQTLCPPLCLVMVESETESVTWNVQKVEVALLATHSLPLSLTLLLLSTRDREMTDTERQRGSKAVLAPSTTERQTETTEETIVATTP